LLVLICFTRCSYDLEVIVSFEHMKMMKLAILALCSCAGICITWEKFEPFNLSTQMQKNVCCKLPARLHQVPEVSESSVPSGQLLSVFFWGKFQNAQLSCNRECGKLFFPTLSSPMYVCPFMALNNSLHTLVDQTFPLSECLLQV